MRIAIDARWIFPQISGIGSYTRELIAHLALVDKDNEYVLLFDNASVMDRVTSAESVRLAANFERHLLGYSPFSPRSQVFLPGRLRDLRVDVYHSPNYMFPFLTFPRNRPGATRCVVTLHDLIPLLFPEMTPRALKTRFHGLYARIMAESAARADVIITPSESTRRDVLANLGLPAGRAGHVVVIPEGVDVRYQPELQDPLIERTILYVGRLDPYKNVVRLVNAFAKVGLANPNVYLRIVGPEDRRYPEARRRAEELGIGGRVRWDGYLDGDQLVAAYQSADVFVLPSRYEGFGLPVLEAMACGTPVVCGNASSLPEVAGNAAILVDPDDTDQLAQAILRVLDEPELVAQMREKGLKRANKFTWSNTAKLTLAAYEQAMALD